MTIKQQLVAIQSTPNRKADSQGDISATVVPMIVDKGREMEVGQNSSTAQDTIQLEGVIVVDFNRRTEMGLQISGLDNSVQALSNESQK